MPRLSSDNYGAAVNVVTWFLLVTTLVTVITRTAMKWVIARKTNFDDAVILLASVFGIGESIAISLNVSNGLGQHVSQLTVFQQAGFEKSYYAAVLLYVPCVSLSKLAVLLLLRTITPVAAHRRIAYTTGVATIAWAGVAEVSAFWYWFGTVQLFLDLVLVILPWIIVRRVQMSMHRKIVIVCCFGTRLAVIVAIIAQLAYFNSATTSTDVSYHLWPEIVCTQVVQSLSIMTACVPYLKPFFDSLESGMIRSDDLRWRRGPDSLYTPSRSIQSPTVAPTRTARSATGRRSEIIVLDAKSKAVPAPPVREVQEPGDAAFRLQRPPKVARTSTKSVSSDVPEVRKATSPGQDGDCDSQTSRSEILRKTRLPSRPRLSRART
ncbi:MAG: hypothetical protein L6R40_007765 [Gallowayella cf. fulva]|nr:MAG: hypothetical protein L6R40_007765 [Xanthomendoza cf. fulva]